MHPHPFPRTGASVPVPLCLQDEPAGGNNLTETIRFFGSVDFLLALSWLPESSRSQYRKNKQHKHAARQKRKEQSDVLQIKPSESVW